MGSTRHYVGLAHRDGGSTYGISFPDVPGCYSAADDIAELIGNAAEALRLYAEDMDLAEPRSIGEVKALPAIVSELEAGAFLVAVPLDE